MRIQQILFALLLSAAAMAAGRKEVDYVNPMIGTDGHGHTYPGASVPFGMVQLSPDAGIRGWDWCSGYHYSDTVIVGFSHTHLSGTGCADLGDILFLPTVGSDALDSLPHSAFSHEHESASPGYYSVELLTHQIKVELTATERVGFHRYTFPKADSAVVVVDLGYGNDDTPMETMVTVENPTTISGYRISSGWAKKQYIYFVAEFSEPFASRELVKDGQRQDNQDEVSGKTTKALLRFNTVTFESPLLIKVAISPVSVEGARRNLNQEIPGWDFDGVRQTAAAAWQQELQKVKIESPDTANLEAFYTALYHTLLAPTLFCDVNGDYRGGDGDVHADADFYNYCTFSLWDTYRAAHPLYTIIAPQRLRDWTGSILSFYQDSGLLPVWPLAGNETWCMIGYHSVPVLVDAYFKGLLPWNAEQILEAMKKSAFQNRRGLQFYNLVTPQPLEKKLAELHGEDVVSTIYPPVTEDTPVLKGWVKSVAGEPISYHSSYPYVRNALISRATDGTMAVEWQTEASPLYYVATRVTFMWAAGLATGKGGHRFDLFVNGEKWLSFNTARDTSQLQWTVRADNGAALTFVPQRRDRFDDLFGNMFLTVPPALQKPWSPLTLRVVGEKGGSPDWYMTFEHAMEDTVRLESEYALAEEQGTSYQFVKLLIERPKAPTSATILLNGKKVLETSLATGLTVIDVPIEAVEKETAIQITIQADKEKIERRFVLRSVMPYDYIPADQERESVSKGLEYAYDDWCIAQMAKALGKTEDAAEFDRRAGYYRNLYDSTTGFMRGRNSDGSWVTPFDPRFGTEKQPQYTEGNAWQYSWYVPQDVLGLISLMGGKETFAAKLDSLFGHSSDLEGLGATADVSGLVGMYAHGNEPSHHIAYLYAYADQPWKTQATVRKIMHDFYTNQPDGLCGNEDCGQMSAWYVFSALGFYPVNPADGKYVFGSPLFERASVDVGDGKTFTVLAHHTSPENMYVQSVKLNGTEYHRRYIAHQEIMKGGMLEFEMGPEPNTQWVMQD